MEYIVVGCRSLVALVFLISAVSKLRDRRSYAGFVAATQRLGPRRVVARHGRPLAAAIVAAELAVPALLLLPATAPAGFGLAVVLLTGFTVAVLTALRRGERAPCHCFGATSEPVGRGQVVRNVLLGIVALLGMAVGPIAGAAPDLAGAMAAVVTGGVIAVLVAAAEDIADLFRSPA